MQSYQDRVDQNLQAKSCPFCSHEPHEIIEENQHFVLLLARAPYTPDHLLIVPKRHVVLMNDLLPEELADGMAIIQKWLDKLHEIYPDVNLLLRDGNVGGNIGKSVDHLHFHLVPAMAIGGDPAKMLHRPFFGDEAYHQLVCDFKAQYLSS